MTFTEAMDEVAKAFEVLGAAVLVLGMVLALAMSGRVWRRTRHGHAAYQTLRETFGGVLLLGVEILVAADLVRTVAVEPTVENVLVLALIVVIRTFLSFSLEIEIDGVPPWRRALVGGGRHVSEAVARAMGTTGTATPDVTGHAARRRPVPPVGAMTSAAAEPTAPEPAPTKGSP